MISQLPTTTAFMLINPTSTFSAQISLLKSAHPLTPGVSWGPSHHHLLSQSAQTAITKCHRVAGLSNRWLISPFWRVGSPSSIHWLFLFLVELFSWLISDFFLLETSPFLFLELTGRQIALFPFLKDWELAYDLFNLN